MTIVTRTRFAPSPTGDLHLGGALVAMASSGLARDVRNRGEDGEMLLRIEDIDTPRVVPFARERILEDLAWLGIEWSGDVVTQSSRTALYESAMARLAALGRLYPCDCSRSEITRIASAPHAGEEVIYPGICRNKDPNREMKRAPSWRFIAQGKIEFHDRAAGSFKQDLAKDVGDFVLRRGDDVFAYQLAVAVDDAEMGITDIVRGLDLLSSTPRQMELMRLLYPARSIPHYAHVPLVVDAFGARLSKRTPGARVRALREAGISRDAVVAWLNEKLPRTANLEPLESVVWPSREIRIPREWADLDARLSPAE